MARILIMEDDKFFRALLRRFLEKEGYEVVDAPDGAVGLRLARGQSFDLVITDIIMPNKDGYEVLEELRSQQPEVPIIGVSGGGGVYNIAFCLDMATRFGARRVLEKPFEWAHLLKVVRECLVSHDRTRDIIRVSPPS